MPSRVKVWRLKLPGRGSSRFDCGKAHVTLAFIDPRVCENYMRTELRYPTQIDWVPLVSVLHIRKRLSVDKDNKYTRPDFDPFHS